MVNLYYLCKILVNFFNIFLNKFNLANKKPKLIWWINLIKNLLKTYSSNMNLVLVQW